MGFKSEGDFLENKDKGWEYTSLVEEIVTEKIMVECGKWKFKQPVTPASDGVTTLFTIPDNYRAGTLRMYISATRLMSGDFMEVPPNQLEIGWAPQPGENVEADYIGI